MSPQGRTRGRRKGAQHALGRSRRSRAAGEPAHRHSRQRHVNGLNEECCSRRQQSCRQAVQKAEPTASGDVMDDAACSRRKRTASCLTHGLSCRRTRSSRQACPPCPSDRAAACLCRRYHRRHLRGQPMMRCGIFISHRTSRSATNCSRSVQPNTGSDIARCV